MQISRVHLEKKEIDLIAGIVAHEKLTVVSNRKENGMTMHYCRLTFFLVKT